MRLFPTRCDGQDIVHWRVRGPRGVMLSPHDDGLGNDVALAETAPGARDAAISVEGEVETRETQGVLVRQEPLPPGYFLRETALTAPDAAIASIAPRAPGDGRARAIALMETVRDAMAFRVGATDARTTAAAAFAAGAGVCQDHAHVLAAACRCAGLPARYVSGYLWTGGDLEPASHAWTEVFVADLGWIGLDAANRTVVGPAHVRLASGLDYAQAAPVTGVRAGGGEERLSVTLGVRAGEQ